MEAYIVFMSRSLSPSEQLARNAAKQQDAYGALAQAIGANDAAGRERAQIRIAELNAEYQRLSDLIRFSELEAREIAGPRTRTPGKPLRELALDALEDLGVPAAPGLIADLCGALTGNRPSPSRFASLRRDEEQAARRNITSRPAWIVPAINATQLTAIPRLLTSSAWSLERRIIGARSARIDHLRLAINLSLRLAHLRESGAAETRNIERMLFPIARSIPGACDTGEVMQPERIKLAAEAEIGLLEGADVAERQAAAAKLANASTHHKLWGRPVLIDAAAAARAIR